MEAREISLKYVWPLVAVTAALVALTLAYRHSGGTAGKHGGANRPLAPQFSVTAIDGQTIDLARYRGKVVLLDFWATWCSPCREETPRFVQLQDKYRAQGLQIIGISMDDSPEPVVQFYREFHMNYPVALGGAKLGELYGGVLGLPIVFVIGRDGRIYAKHIGTVQPSVLERDIATLLSSTT